MKKKLQTINNSFSVIIRNYVLHAWIPIQVVLFFSFSDWCSILISPSEKHSTPLSCCGSIRSSWSWIFVSFSAFFLRLDSSCLVCYNVLGRQKKIMTRVMVFISNSELQVETIFLWIIYLHFNQMVLLFLYSWVEFKLRVVFFYYSIIF